MKITLSRNGMRAALIFAAEKDIRYYLCGILLEATKTTTRVTATNGHVGAVHQSSAENEFDEGELSFSIIIPREVVKLIGKVSKKDSGLPLVLEPNGDDGFLIRDMASAIRLGFDPIIAKFPDLTKVIPKTANGEHAQYNPLYVGLMGKAAVALGSNPWDVTFRHNGDGAGLAIVGGAPEFVAVVMPMRNAAENEETTTRPLWLEEGVVNTEGSGSISGVQG